MGLIAHVLRGFFRTNFKPINPKVAKKWAVSSSLAYFLLAWTTVGVTTYYYFNAKSDNPDSPYVKGRAFTPYDSIVKFGSDSGNKIVRIQGWNKIETEVVSKEQAKEEIKKYQ